MFGRETRGDALAAWPQDVTTFMDSHGEIHKPANVLLSTSHCDADKPKLYRLAEALLIRKCSVFCTSLTDGFTPGLDIAQALDWHLKQANTVLVCWSPDSVMSKWVLEEAAIARAEGKLVACMLEKCVLPEPFDTFHFCDLTDWRGERREQHDKLNALLDLVQRRIHGTVRDSGLTIEEHTKSKKPLLRRLLGF